MLNLPFRVRSVSARRWLNVAIALLVATQFLVAQPVRAQPMDEPHVSLAAPQRDAAAALVVAQGIVSLSVPLQQSDLNNAPTPPPPKPGTVIVEDALTGGGLIPTGSCPSGRVMAETVGDGLILKVRGPCVGSSTVAAARTKIPGLRVPDGEFRFDVKFVSGSERGTLMLILRYGETKDRMLGHAFVLGPTIGAGIVAFNEGGSQMLGLKPAPTTVAWGDWTAVSIRAQGNGLWLLLNDTPTLYAEEGSFTDGEVLVSLNRSGNVNDEAETAAVLRNARVSALDGSAPARSPVYQAPGPAPRQNAPGGPPKCDFGVPVLIRDPDGVERWYCDQTDWNQ